MPKTNLSVRELSRESLHKVSFSVSHAVRRKAELPLSIDVQFGIRRNHRLGLLPEAVFVCLCIGSVLSNVKHLFGSGYIGDLRELHRPFTRLF